MAVVLAVLLAGEAGIDPGTFERLGTAGIVAVVLSAIIGWLLRDRAKERADKDRIIAQRDEMVDRLVDSEARSSATLATVAPILEATNQELRLARERAR